MCACMEHMCLCKKKWGKENVGYVSLDQTAKDSYDMPSNLDFILHRSGSHGIFETGSEAIGQ